MNEGKRGYKDVKHMAAPKKPGPKPRNPVAKNAMAAIGGGAAGAHADKKKDSKQGKVKHKKRMPADMMEGRDYEKKLAIMLKMENIRSQLKSLKEYETHTYKDSQGNVWRVDDEGNKELVSAAPGSSGGGSRYGSRYPRRSYTQPQQSTGMYFYNVQPGQENDAMNAGLKQTKTGKWYSKYSNPSADQLFGPGRFWQPKNEGMDENGLGAYIGRTTFGPDSKAWKESVKGGKGTEQDPYTFLPGTELNTAGVLMRNLALIKAGKEPSYDNFGPTGIKIYFEYNGKLYIGDGSNKIMRANVDQGVAEGSKHASRPGTKGRPGSAEQAQADLNRKRQFKADSEKRRAEEKNKGQGVAEGFDNPEYDDEAGMADNNLETLERAVQGIDDLINAGDNLPEWCQEKIAVAKSMLVTVWDYMKSEEERAMGESMVYEKAPPGWSEQEMQDLKKKYGPDRAFAVAWAAYKKAHPNWKPKSKKK